MQRSFVYVEQSTWVTTALSKLGTTRWPPRASPYFKNTHAIVLHTEPLDPSNKEMMCVYLCLGAVSRPQSLPYIIFFQPPYPRSLPYIIFYQPSYPQSLPYIIVDQPPDPRSLSYIIFYRPPNPRSLPYIIVYQAPDPRSLPYIIFYRPPNPRSLPYIIFYQPPCPPYLSDLFIFCSHLIILWELFPLSPYANLP
jgi:hypothetical protein